MNLESARSASLSLQCLDGMGYRRLHHHRTTVVARAAEPLPADQLRIENCPPTRAIIPSPVVLGLESWIKSVGPYSMWLARRLAHEEYSARIAP